MLQSQDSKSIPFVSVIIPTYHDWDKLQLCLDALDKQTYSQNKFEIIVVNNDPNDPCPLTNLPTNCLLITETKSGSYAARNTGVQKAQGEIIAFTDADCIPTSHWLEKGVNLLLANPNCGLLAGKVELFFQDRDNPTPIELYDKVSSFPQKKYVKQRKFGVTANLLTHKTVLETVGYFNDNLKSGGDHEFGLRAYKNGYQILYISEVCIQHPARKSWQELHQRIIRKTSGMLDVASLNNSVNDRVATFLNWIAYITPSPRITYLIFTEESINSLPKKVQTILIMILVKLFRAIELGKIITGIRSKKY